MGILQATILEWVALPSSRESSQSRDWTQISHIADWFFTIWATREAHKLMNIAKKEQTHGDTEQTSGDQWGEQKGRDMLGD